MFDNSKIEALITNIKYKAKYRIKYKDPQNKRA